MAMPGFPVLAGRKTRAIALTTGILGLVLAGSIIAAFNPFGPRLQQFPLGDFRLASGEMIGDAVIGYRTQGRLNDDRSNAILVLPWHTGTSARVARQRLVDSSGYFVITVDTFGNGIASSPSNSRRQPDASFPRFTIGDMVESQYRLVTQALGLDRLHAVIGISMGGMQVFEWAVAYPAFVKKAAAIVGTPQTQPEERALWSAGLVPPRQSRWKRAAAMLARGKPRSAYGEFVRRPYDQIRQSEAIITHDIARHFDGSLARAGAAIQAELFIAGTLADDAVDNRTAFALARDTGADLLELDGRCGHQAPSCNWDTLKSALTRFLAR